MTIAKMMTGYSIKMVFFSFLLAFILTILPIPNWAVMASPAWVLLILIYWTLFFPERIPIELAWVLGIILDILQNTLLGEHAFVFVLIIYFVKKFSHRLKMFPILQQSVCIFFLIVFYQGILFCIQGLIGVLPLSRIYWVSSLTSLLIWPWICGMLHSNHNHAVAASWQKKF